jgi:mRNA-degrading endonuclease RelE of RelBE toxin-antitoxin system
MNYSVAITNKFRREYRRLDKPIQVLVDDAVVLISENPALGTAKTADLIGIYVYKFRFRGRLYLLGYEVNNQVRLIYLLSIKSHQNFYRDLKDQ